MGLSLVVLSAGCSSDEQNVGLFGADEGDSSLTSASTDGTTDGSGDTHGEAGTTGDSGTTGGSTGDDGGSTDEAGDTTDSGGLRLDVPQGGDDGIGPCDPATDPTCSGCTAVDVLFVIDNSGTMCSKQQNLNAAFPGFVDAMYDALPPGTDLHVAVTTSGFSLGGSHSESNCVAQEPLSTLQQFYTRPTEGTVMGNGLQGRLYEQDGRRFYAVDTSDPSSKAGLSAWFTAAASGVGCSVSSFEFNASGAAWALHPSNAATNDGFLRDEGAALVLFILTDEGDQSLDVETVQFLHDTVVDAKPICGEDCIIPGGLLPTLCPDGTNGSLEFLESFTNPPITGDIGGFFGPPPDYEAVVGNALATVVAETCEEIIPAG